MRKKLNLDEVKAFIDAQSPESKVYLGCDSEKYRVRGVWYADFILAIVVHRFIDGVGKGCKIFAEIQTERDFDAKKDKPALRLMMEVAKVAELYLKMADQLVDREVEIHLDINPAITAGSSCVLTEAIGYIRGVCNIEPLVKPNAFAASYAADRAKELQLAA